MIEYGLTVVHTPARARQGGPYESLRTGNLTDSTTITATSALPWFYSNIGGPVGTGYGVQPRHSR